MLACSTGSPTWCSTAAVCGKRHRRRYDVAHQEPLSPTPRPASPGAHCSTTCSGRWTLPCCLTDRRLRPGEIEYLVGHGRRGSADASSPTWCLTSAAAASGGASSPTWAAATIIRTSSLAWAAAAITSTARPSWPPRRSPAPDRRLADRAAGQQGAPRQRAIRGVRCHADPLGRSGGDRVELDRSPVGPPPGDQGFLDSSNRRFPSPST